MDIPSDRRRFHLTKVILDPNIPTVEQNRSDTIIRQKRSSKFRTHPTDRILPIEEPCRLDLEKRIASRRDCIESIGTIGERSRLQADRLTGDRLARRELDRHSGKSSLCWVFFTVVVVVQVNPTGHRRWDQNLTRCNCNSTGSIPLSICVVGRQIQCRSGLLSLIQLRIVTVEKTTRRTGVLVMRSAELSPKRTPLEFRTRTDRVETIVEFRNVIPRVQMLHFVDIDREDQSIASVEILEVQHQLHRSIENLGKHPSIRILGLQGFDLKAESLVGPSARLDGVKQIVGNAVTRRVLIGIDHQPRQLGIGNPPLEGHIERIPVRIATAVLLNVNPTDPKRFRAERIAIENHARLKLLDRAAPKQPLKKFSKRGPISIVTPTAHRIFSRALESSYCAETGCTKRPCESAPDNALAISQDRIVVSNDPENK